MQCRPAGGVSHREKKRGAGIKMGLDTIWSSGHLRPDHEAAAWREELEVWNSHVHLL